MGGGRVWVTDTSSGSVVKIDPRTRQVVARIPAGSDPTALAYGGGHLWVTNSGDGTVDRIDPATQDVQAVRVGAPRSRLTYSDGGVWVTVREPAAGKGRPGLVVVSPRRQPAAGGCHRRRQHLGHRSGRSLQPPRPNVARLLRQRPVHDSSDRFDPAIEPYGPRAGWR